MFSNLLLEAPWSELAGLQIHFQLLIPPPAPYRRGQTLAVPSGSGGPRRRPVVQSIAMQAGGHLGSTRLQKRIFHPIAAATDQPTMYDVDNLLCYYVYILLILILVNLQRCKVYQL